MAGGSKDFEEQGHIYPKYLLEINGEPIMQQIIKSLSNLHGKLTFIIRKEDNEKSFIGSALRILVPQSSIITVANTTRGAVCTALFAVDEINNDEDVLILNGDQLINTDLQPIIKSFKDQKWDGGIITFRSIHPRWSYVMLNETGYVVQTSEKRPISNLATAGCYWFKSGKEFIEACYSVIRKDVNYQDNYYISSTFNELILLQKKIGTKEIKKKDFISFSTLQMYENYINQKNNNYD